MQTVETRLIRYTCELCHKVFERVEPKVLECMVRHPPGQCCHYGEKEVAVGSP